MVVVAFAALLMGAAASLVPLLCWAQGGDEVVVVGWRLGIGDDDLRWRPWWVVVTSAGGDVEAAWRRCGGSVEAGWMCVSCVGPACVWVCG